MTSAGGSNSGTGRLMPMMSSDARIFLQPVLDPVPVLQERAVVRHVEVRVRDAGVHRAGALQQCPVGGQLLDRCRARRRRRACRTWPPGAAPAARGRTAARRAGRRRRCRASGLVDALAGVLPEEHVAPVEEVVDVGHDDRAAVGRRAQRRDRVRVERVVAVGGHQARAVTHQLVLPAEQPEHLDPLQQAPPRLGRSRSSSAFRTRRGRSARRRLLRGRRGSPSSALVRSRACRNAGAISSTSSSTRFSSSPTVLSPSARRSARQPVTSASTSTARNGRNRQYRSRSGRVEHVLVPPAGVVEPLGVAECLARSAAGRGRRSPSSRCRWSCRSRGATRPARRRRPSVPAPGSWWRSRWSC